MVTDKIFKITGNFTEGTSNYLFEFPQLRGSKKIGNHSVPGTGTILISFLMVSMEKKFNDRSG
jgi:hypothetical protein